MRKPGLLIILGAILFLSACDGSVTKPIQPANTGRDPFATGDKIPEDLIVRLKRTPCYGTCPAYLLTINAKGEVEFLGEQYTKVNGQAKGRIDEAKVRQLIEEFEKAKFFELKDDYTSENCGTDMPTVRTTLLINGNVKKIEHDKGCDAPPELTALENSIDAIAGTSQWIGERK